MFLNPPSVIFKTFIPPSPIQLKSTFLSSIHHPLYNWIQYFSIYSSCLSILSHSFLSLPSFPYFQFFSLINPTSSLILSLLFFSLPLDPFFQFSQAFDPFPTFLLLQFLPLLFSLHLDPFPFFPTSTCSSILLFLLPLVSLSPIHMDQSLIYPSFLSFLIFSYLGPHPLNNQIHLFLPEIPPSLIPQISPLSFPTSNSPTLYITRSTPFSLPLLFPHSLYHRIHPFPPLPLLFPHPHTIGSILFFLLFSSPIPYTIGFTPSFQLVPQTPIPCNPPLLFLISFLPPSPISQDPLPPFLTYFIPPPLYHIIHPSLSLSL